MKKSMKFNSTGIPKQLAIQRNVYFVTNLGSEGTHGYGILNNGHFLHYNVFH